MAKFVSLSFRLKDHWKKPFAKLPTTLATEVKNAFFPFSWDSIAASQRQDLASQIDYNNDPATEAERAAVWELSVKRLDLERELREVELLAANVPTEYAAKRSLLSEIKSQISEAKKATDVLLGDDPDDRQEAAPEPMTNPARKGLSEHQRAAAQKRHKEHYQFKSDVLQHYQEHKAEYKNMTDAATKIAGKVVYMPMRTVYGWIRDWEKIQSAG